MNQYNDQTKEIQYLNADIMFLKGSKLHGAFEQM